MSSSGTLTIGEVEELENRRHAAMVAGDVDVLDELLSPDAVYTHANAAVDSKETYLGILRDGTLVYHALEHTAEKVLRRPGVVVVNGRMSGSVHMAGVPKTLNSRFAAVWVAEDGGWHLLAYQSTPLPA
jgi:ketosteroid isomerase-like protein